MPLTHKSFWSIAANNVKYLLLLSTMTGDAAKKNVPNAPADKVQRLQKYFERFAA